MSGWMVWQDVNVKRLSWLEESMDDDRVTNPDGMLDTWRHPLVRDLGWLCLAPDLLSMPCPGRPRLDELGLANGGWRDYLDRLEAAPQALEDWVGGAMNARLGHYHERLWQFLLESSPNTRLLAHNLPVMRERRTLGELDMVYQQTSRRRPSSLQQQEHRPCDVPIHLEVAIKFYLGLTEGPGDATDQARWVGPGCADSLAGKRSHLFHHQLPLIDTPEARLAVSEFTKGTQSGRNALENGERSLDQRMAMPGVLFYPWQRDPAKRPLPSPVEATAEHLRGQWLTWHDWPAFRAELVADTQGAWLHKPHWLAPPLPERLRPLEEVEAYLATRFSTGAAPLPLVLKGEDDTWHRLFIVGDDWPRKLPLPPAQVAFTR
ncbi:MAG: DUF1853 family protein [Onishia taeanensis]|uniref:DUF1853 family protein n=1 Tax=Onishia taeanensis TaxID=284577 RepID=A0A328XK39_9GAMM|nr:DUF1853 family protein [Halomonas taeanensis]RAR59051.1 hypothetical protein BCL93_11084 [Halomonas taeanensis]